LVLGLLAISNLGLPAGSKVIEKLSDLDKARLAEALHLRNTLGDSVWPGWGHADIPTILYNEEYAFLVGLPDPAPGWYVVPNMTRLGNAWEVVTGDTFDGQPYYRQRLPGPGVTPQGFTVLVGERWVGSFNTKDWMEISMARFLRDGVPSPLRYVFPYRIYGKLLVDGSDLYICLILHEAFHAYEGIIVPERLNRSETSARQSESRYPWDDQPFNNAWKAELDLLSKALQTDSLPELTDLARQFLTARQERRGAQRLSQDLVNYEHQREWEEGLAKYMELAMWRAGATTPGYQPVPAMDTDPDFKAYKPFEKRWSQEAAQTRRLGDEVRFYYAGFAQAVILDHLLPGWKERIFSKEDVWLEGLIEEALQSR
jgi:hypothetical protein